MTDVTTHDLKTRHGFLAALHDLLQPKVYLEVGVQFGTSLELAHTADLAIGIDPHPLALAHDNQAIFAVTSDEFFHQQTGSADLVLRNHPVDFGFIDGMHLAEYALRDFANIEQHCHPLSIIVFDDVLPRNQHEARRLEPGTEIVGDWTGDVWRVESILQLRSLYLTSDAASLTLRLVDTQPTGLLLVTGFGVVPPEPAGWADTLEFSNYEVPSGVLNRSDALTPLVALQQIRTELIQGV